MNEIGVLRALSKKIAAPSEGGVQAHHQLLADRIDRRIGDLGKELLEISVKQTRLERKHSQRCVVTHGTNSFGPILEHRLDDHLDLFG